MSLPDIDFAQIRLHGNQADAFEELCCQLASDEASPDRIRFDRKGRGGDAGVECFETLANGSEIGWQVKFYWNADSMLRALGKSLDTALVKHPKMCEFIACFPFDLADARKDGTHTALQKWDDWRASRIMNAAKSGRVIEIKRWDAHALRQRLISNNPRAAGRIAFWFDQLSFTREWFKGKFARAEAGLGERYNPRGHIDLPISLAVRAITNDPIFYEDLKRLGDTLRKAAEEAFPIKGTPVADACDTAVSALHAAVRSKVVPVAALCETIRAATDAAFVLHEELHATNGGAEPNQEAAAVSNLAVRLRWILFQLRQPYWALLGQQSLLVHGVAGSGKSHLLADACAHQLDAGRPALMILGGTLADDEPWSQILKGLDLPRHLEVGQFLGALNAAGEAAGVRTLIAIDALNERNGQAIWPERLAGLLHDIEQFPWIAVVLSCRTTYLDLVIPDTLDARKLPQIEHHGFSIVEVRTYLQRHGMTLPETPLQVAEFQTPLFLRLYCDALKSEGATLLARGLGSVTEVFRVYTASVIRRVHLQLRVPPGRSPATAALAGLVREMADTGRSDIVLDRAEAIVRTIHSGRSSDDDLLFQLQNEGILAVDPTLTPLGETVQTVRFTFERMGDHAVAADLLMRSDRGSVVTLGVAGSPLRDALDSKKSKMVRGLLEALAVQLPEDFEIELPDLSGLPATRYTEDAFKQSLQARRLEAFTARTWALVERIGGASLRYDTLIALATEPGHSNNVRHLDAELRALRMSVRDASWTIYLARSPDAALHLVNWVRAADPDIIAPERAELAAIQLSWFLTATHRAVRDKATKALVVLFANRAELAMRIWRVFAGLDDLYVVERLAAALFGAAMQGRWSMEDLRTVAEVLRDSLFVGGRPPANKLLRDHASGTIGYAAAKGALLPDFDLVLTKPPFLSDWPIERISDEQIAEFTVAYNDEGERYRDDITRSLHDGDFARYVLDPIARRFSPAPRGAKSLPTDGDLRSQWLAEFTASASQEEIAAYNALQARIDAIKEEQGGRLYAPLRADLRAAKRAFREAIGSPRFEDWRARAENWRDEGMYQEFPASGAASFNLAWARRWVAWRAHDLGWSEALHNEFDRRIGTGRNGHRIERIGKKYQWLAAFELAARMEDNLAVLPRGEEEGPNRLRDIDPSMLRESTEDDGWRRPRGTSFWAPYSPTIEAATPGEALAWLSSSAAILDDVENIEVVDEIGRQWLVLRGFESWDVDRDKIRSESWRRISCTVVRASDLGQLLAGLKEIHLTAHHDVPVGGADSYRMHLGEHPWAWPDRSNDGWIEWWPNGHDQRVSFSVRPPIAEYDAESNGYDFSITQNISLNLPAGWLFHSLGLRLSDGRSIEYRNAGGEVMFMDPSVNRTGRSAALVDRAAFLNLLASENLVAIWAIAGEKSVYGGRHSEGFGGRRTFTRLFHSKVTKLQALPRFETIDKPTRRQRAILFGQDPEILTDEGDDSVVEN